MAISLNDTVEITSQTRLGGVLTDPTALTLIITDPTGHSSTYHWPTPADITRDSVGEFHYDQVTSLPGTWVFTWSATGAVVGVQNGAFTVSPALETVTIHVTDSLSNPLPGVNVQIYENPLTIIAGGQTDSTGKIVVKISPEIDALELQRVRTMFANPYSMTIANTGGLTPQSFTFIGTPLGIVETAQPLTVRLFGHIIGLDGQPADGVRVQVETLGFGNYRPFILPNTGSDTGVDPINLAIHPEKRELRTDSTGYWEVDLVADAIVRVEILDMRFDKLFRVPNDPRITTLNIRDVRPDPGPGAEVGITSDTGGKDLLRGNS